MLNITKTDLKGGKYVWIRIYKNIWLLLKLLNMEVLQKQQNYSQSGISRMISDLEKEWNISLLERSKSGVELTSEGLN